MASFKKNWFLNWFNISLLCRCLFILLIIVCRDSRFLLCLLLFLECHFSNSTIYIIVSVSFLISLFVFLTFSVGKCCCGL